MSIILCIFMCAHLLYYFVISAHARDYLTDKLVRMHSASSKRKEPTLSSFR